MSNKSYYEILEISERASEADIKKAYRQLALKWHPDKNPDKKEEAEKRFKEISEAYEVLSDKNKREMYDRYGKEGIKAGFADRHQQRGSRGQNHDIFAEFGFGDPFGFGGFGNNGSFRNPQDIFEEFFGTKNIFDLFENQMFNGQEMPNNISKRTTSSSLFSDPSSFTNVSKSTSRSTKMINGNKIVTTKIKENGVETVTVEENGVLKSRTVNGVAQAIEF